MWLQEWNIDHLVLYLGYAHRQKGDLARECPAAGSRSRIVWVNRTNPLKVETFRWNYKQISLVYRRGVK